MDQVVEIFTNKYFVAVSGLASLIALPLAIYFYQASKEKYQIRYAVAGRFIFQTAGLFLDKIPYEVRFDGEIVHHVRRDNIMIYNCGNRTIESSDLTYPCSVELTSSAADTKILGYRVIFVDDDSCNIHLSHDKKTMMIDFDFLRPSEGFVVQIDHDTSEGWKPAGLRIVASTKRGRAGRSYINLFVWIAIVATSIIGAYMAVDELIKSAIKIDPEVAYLPKWFVTMEYAAAFFLFASIIKLSPLFFTAGGWRKLRRQYYFVRK